MRTEIRTFKAGDLKNQITIPLHQRWKEKHHISNLNNSIKANGFLTAVTLYEIRKGLYSVEDGYQRLSSVIEKMPDQEIHAVVVPNDTKVKPEDVFLSLNNIRKPLQIQDYIRFHATKRSVNPFDNDNFYTFVWNKIYNTPETPKELDEAMGLTGVFSHSSIKMMFTQSSNDAFRSGNAKMQGNSSMRLRLYYLLQSMYIDEINKIKSWDKMTHKLSKCALVVILNNVIRKTKNVDNAFKELIKFALYLDSEMPPYLNTTKDNVSTYYNEFKKNKLSTVK
jgi:flagellar biosynthesis regulator FlbT